MSQWTEESRGPNAGMNFTHMHPACVLVDNGIPHKSTVYLGQQKGETWPSVDIRSPKYSVQSPVSKHIFTVSTLGGGWREGWRGRGKMEEGGVVGNGEERKQKVKG